MKTKELIRALLRQPVDVFAEYKAMVLDQMDAQGMLPQTPCLGCGKPLNAGGMHPAETYAGSATGYCYTCAGGPAYVVKTLRSGAQLWSCPAVEPSYRRDRQTFYKFEGCGCSYGRVIQTTRFGKWPAGMVAEQCPRCRIQHQEHPTTRAEAARRQAFDTAHRTWEDLCVDKTVQMYPDINLQGYGKERFREAVASIRAQTPEPVFQED